MYVKSFGVGEELVHLKQKINCLDLGGIVLSQSFPFLIVYFRQISVTSALILYRTLEGTQIIASVSSCHRWGQMLGVHDFM